MENYDAEGVQTLANKGEFLVNLLHELTKKYVDEREAQPKKPYITKSTWQLIQQRDQRKRENKVEEPPGHGSMHRVLVRTRM